jgi:NAD(P)-dependent dehydrogenase (short-subunit alcohol dehydrogenase family)
MKNGQPVVLVTGANGFVGRHVTPALIREGWVVRRVVRKSSGAEGETVIETLGPSTNWQDALVDVDAVVHLAARVHQRSSSIGMSTSEEPCTLPPRRSKPACDSSFLSAPCLCMVAATTVARPLAKAIH